MSRPHVFVIVPIVNGFTAAEVIYADDGSTDDTIDTLRRVRAEGAAR